ncbi:DUF397 domain-containing protein [Plantactinospora sp. WMMB334]|uniref:DUF397 domain-containing protein n=1 Tax=Plantactinospora sp. WMMB334 TaxID=3404119 RepID=UPI003B94CBC6
MYGPLSPDALASARFRKSRRSDNSGSCIEVADNLLLTHGVVLMRDSKDAGGPVLTFVAESWRTFVNGVHAGAFDL